MGMDASAYLAYGIICEDETNPLNDADVDGFLDEDEEFEDLGEYLALRAGFSNPWRKLPDEVNYGPREKYEAWKRDNPWFEKATSEWSEIKRQSEDAAPVEIAYSGTHDYKQYLLTLKDTERYAWDYTAKYITIPEIEPYRVDEAIRFCKEHGLPDFSDAQWVLYPFYG